MSINPLDLITIDSLAGIQIAWLALGGLVGIAKVTPPEVFLFGWLVSN